MPLRVITLLKRLPLKTLALTGSYPLKPAIKTSHPERNRMEKKPMATVQSANIRKAPSLEAKLPSGTERGCYRKCPYDAGWISRKCKDLVSPGTKRTVRNNKVSVLSRCPQSGVCTLAYFPYRLSVLLKNLYRIPHLNIAKSSFPS